MTLRNKLAGAAGAVSLALAASAATAADYPDKSVTLVAPYGPGGAADLAARTIAKEAPEYLGANIQVVNRTGAGGATGSASVVNAEPDGYELLLGRVGSQTVSPAMKANMPYEYDEFTYLGVIEINPVICATSTDNDIQSMSDLVERVRANPGAVTYSSSGVGTLLHIAAVLTLDEFGIENPVQAATHIPFRGGGEAAAAAVTGQVSFVCTNSSALMSHIQGGKLRPLVVTTEEPLEGVDAPTARALGHEDLEVLVGWSGILGPPDLPAEVKDTWKRVLNEISEDESWLETSRKRGSVPAVMDPESSLEFVRNQYQTFRELVQRLDMEIK